MPSSTLTFENALPVTLQVGDEIWYLQISTGQEIKFIALQEDKASSQKATAG